MKKFLLIGIPVLLLILLGGFILWALTPAGPSEEALQALVSDQEILVTSFPKWLAFETVQGDPESVIVIYPGGRVDYRSYAPVARQLAGEGSLVILVRMPLNLAVFGANRVEEVFNAYPAQETWFLGGHSLGGSMAASYAYDNPGRIEGLFLWASYPSTSQSLAESDLPVISIYGSLDGVATPADIMESKPYLPANTLFTEIIGGNHAQFGSYGEQKGDNPAAISPQEQQDQISGQMSSFIFSVLQNLK